MIRDAQNTFCKDLDVSSATSAADYTDVIFLGGGDCVDQMYLVIAVTKPLQDGTLAATLQTSDTEDFTTAKDMLSAHVSKSVGMPVKMRLPIGMQKYARIKYAATLDADKTSIGSGLVTSFLAYDVDIAGF